MAHAREEYIEPSEDCQIVYNPLPAVAIGGPPHSGKSVLTYSLTQALRLRSVDHYVIRAYPPDGEGDWFQAGDRETVRHYRVKREPGGDWVAPLVRDVAARHLPLIVDMGGLPTAEQETVLAACTHGVVLAPDRASQAAWRARFERYGLVLLADLRSELRGQDRLTAAYPILRGTLAGLERGRLAHGPAFVALFERLTALFRSAAQDLRRRHLAAAPVELAVDLTALARPLDIDPRRWPPRELPRVLDYLPAGQTLGLYGRGPNWLYAAVARHTAPAPFYLFDVRHGWVRAPDAVGGVPTPRVGGPTPPRPSGVEWLQHTAQPLGSDSCAGHPVHATLTHVAGRALLTVELTDAYLDLAALPPLAFPVVAEDALILSGKLPLWLWAALARAYCQPWLAVMQPQLGGAVVIAAEEGAPGVGAVVPVPAAGGEA
ncbi:MAG: CRISPR-associated protein Csx3 [Paracoccaceae bacterium]